MKAWRARDPVTRFQHWLVQQGWWSDEQDKEARAAARRWVQRVVRMGSPADAGRDDGQNRQAQAGQTGGCGCDSLARVFASACACTDVHLK